MNEPIAIRSTTVAVLLLVGLPACLGTLLAAPVRAQGSPGKGAMALESVPDSRWRLDGVVAPRLEANIDQWLLQASEANPAMLEMFRLRDRQPTPRLVPWAGEFAGKYLISCVQALRLTGREDLRAHTAGFVAQLIGVQDADGYLGPFPKSRRLLGNWDLWGHYHVMQGLLLWHDVGGDAAAMAAVRRAADLICRTYLDGQRRVFDAGSHEMNMAVSHVMAELHRRTGEPRYLALANEIVKEWQRAGDYLRTGEAGTPFYRTPRPRWESLHDLQALVELWRITGETRYRDAFASHWRTIRQWDRRNTGAFSGGEMATGNAFTPSAIETCCTVAWMALSCDMLRLTGDPQVADELELSTYNAAMGAQHPSGRWWTYNTPMDGERKASAHDIVFQARAGSPELNCCSVNGPRSLGMLGDWAVMREPGGLVVNWLGPMEVAVKQAAGGSAAVRCETSYPLDGHIAWRVTSAAPLRLRIRIPAWAQGVSARLAGKPLPVKPGAYLEVERVWKDADRLELDLPLVLRTLEGQREQVGKVSLYRGPLLLAYDQRDNAFDETHIPSLDLGRLQGAKIVVSRAPGDRRLASWLLVDVPTAATTIRLRDFANAGACGTRYRSWLRVAGGEVPIGRDGLIVADKLAGTARPEFGKLLSAAGLTPVDDGLAVRLNGTDGKLLYSLPDRLGPDFSVAVRVRVRAFPADKRIGQVFSAWGDFLDDPLRLTVDGGRLFARIEAAGRAFTSPGVPLTLNQWYRVVAVKSGGKLKLYVDGVLRGATDVPKSISTTSRMFAIGANPAYGGPEFLAADFADLVVRNRALSDAEVAALGRR